MFRLLLAGTFTGEIIRIISNIGCEDGKGAVQLDNCGRFVLADDLSDIADITNIDLSSISSLEGKSTTQLYGHSCTLLSRISPLKLLPRMFRMIRR
jgi:hypothetical protein